MSDAMFMFLTGLILMYGRNLPAVVIVASITLIGCGVLGLIVDRSKK
jgi:hypothetical protein